MIILITIGVMLAVPLGIAIAIDLRGRWSGRVNARRVDAAKASSLTTWIGDSMSTGEYFPRLDDGRPRH